MILLSDIVTARTPWIQRNIHEKIINFFMTVDILIAVAIPILVCIAFVFSWAIVLHLFFGDNIPQVLMLIGLGIGSLIFGFSGIIQLRRRESPGFAFNKPFRGTYAIINGIFLTLIFWGLGVVMLIIALLEALGISL